MRLFEPGDWLLPLGWVNAAVTAAGLWYSVKVLLPRRGAPGLRPLFPSGRPGAAFQCLASSSAPVSGMKYVLCRKYVSQRVSDCTRK
ncbi:MAG: hypothetical protein MR428_07520 [Mesosutterella sp.]|nr:hypothetical protein [Mesosutterella sp.]